MKIVKKRKFIKSLALIFEYMAKDKPFAAKTFKETLYKKFENLKTFPKMYRKSIYFNDENYRDLIYKGYTVIYKIEKDKIIILDIFKWSENYEN
ncbi:type II toxin-antitoxin system RelE/ParE family toxin [Nautilia sp.]